VGRGRAGKTLLFTALSLFLSLCLEPDSGLARDVHPLKVRLVPLKNQDGEFLVVDGSNPAANRNLKSFFPASYRYEEDLEAGTRFVVAGANSNRVIKAMKSLTGVPLDTLTERALVPPWFKRYAFRYDLVGFHSTSASRKTACETISRLDADWYRGRVLAGGPGALHAGELLEAGVDVVVHGEGETAMVELLRAYSGDMPFSSIKGLSYIDGEGNRVDTGEPEPVDLTQLPFPSWERTEGGPTSGDMLNITLKRPFFVVMGSRGCPFRCGFCASHQLWRRRYRPRPVENVLDEVEWLISTHGARYVHFLDDIFGMSPGWADAFCDGMERRRLKVEFAVVLHPMSFKNERRRILGRLRDVGCRLVSLGAQSADPGVLRAIRRSPREPEGFREAVAVANELGIVSVLTFIFGLPGDTDDSIRRTVDFVNEVKPTVVDFHPLLYLPGSEIAESMDPSKFCRLTTEEINRWCMRASFEYYVLHGGGLRVLSYLVFRNPGWFVNLVPIGSYLAEYLGLMSDRRDTRRFL